MNYHIPLHALRVLTAVGLALLTACGDGGSPPPSAPGPVPLRDTAHMKSYVGSGEWRLVAADTDRWFRFTSDGRFAAGGDGMPGLLGYTAAVNMVMGRWDVDMTTLYLTEIGTGIRSEAATLTKSLPLRWADGKLNIYIADENYRR